jgi:hypothetical protein
MMTPRSVRCGARPAANSPFCDDTAESRRALSLAQERVHRLVANVAHLLREHEGALIPVRSVIHVGVTVSGERGEYFQRQRRDPGRMGVAVACWRR